MQPASRQPLNPADYGRQHNFSAGPGTLPLDVMLEVRDELPVYPGVGASIMEISHRSAAYDAIHQRAQARMRSLLGVGEEWHVLFLQGGASMQFYQTALNFLPAGGSADYLNTGAWSKKAIKEAKRIGKVNVAASSEDQNFSYIPDPQAWNLDPNAAYLHYTSNNTIFGTEFHATPKASVPLVCDASSDFLSRSIDMQAHGLIYAGAQKNIGPAGVTAVMIHDDFLQRRNSDLPTMLDYGTHVGEMFNTPPVFAVYIVDKVLGWLEGLGGLTAIDAINERKAQKLYERIDRTEFYRGTADVASRSRMNVCFRLPSEELESKFVSEAKGQGMSGLKGHRSVGGIRASIYNACPEASVEALVQFMDDFEARNG